MFFFIAVTTKMKELGNANNLVCPSCGALSYMTVTVMYEVLYLFFIPIFKWNKRYAATSSCCKSVFEVEHEAGQAFEKGETDTLNPSSLQKIHIYSGKNNVCPYCGAGLNDGAKYCSQCGKPV